MSDASQSAGTIEARRQGAGGGLRFRGVGLSEGGVHSRAVFDQFAAGWPVRHSWGSRVNPGCPVASILSHP